jgi:hypothetical protein
MKWLLLTLLLTLNGCITTPIRQCRNVCFATLTSLDDANNPTNADVRSRQAYLVTFDPWKYGDHANMNKGDKHVIVKITMNNGLVFWDWCEPQDIKLRSKPPAGYIDFIPVSKEWVLSQSMYKLDE